MRFREIIEAKLAGTSGIKRMSAPNVTTVDPSAPWVRKQISKANAFSKKFDAAETSKEKFDLVYKAASKLKTPLNTHLRIVLDMEKMYSSPTFAVGSYDPVTGDIELIHSVATRHTRYSGNVNNFEYHHAERLPGTTKVYYFSPGNLDKKDTYSTYDKSVNRTGSGSPPAIGNPLFPKVHPIPTDKVRVIKKLTGDE